MATKRVILSKAFDYSHKRGRRGMTSYPAGYDGPMPEAHADLAIAKGYGELSTSKADAKDVASATAGSGTK